MSRLLFALGVLALVVTATAGAGADRTAYSCAPGADVSFRATDGTRLVGHVFGKGPKAVVLGHQSQSDLCDWATYGRRLAGLGYTAFAIDFRGHGLSQHREGPAGTRLAADVAGAVKLMRQRGKKKVFVVGASMGGIAALVGAANVKPAVDGVVSVSAPARFLGMDAVATAPRLRVPVLYLAAADDDNAGYDFSKDATALHGATASADKRLVILPGFLHGVALIGGSARARSLVEAFLKGH
ncbi:MAG TPA: alpha/beta fold hydrolase [Gaiellaceae bacterium]|nr:alpha/beta fold hydrolase [Gaiellaceae bacterium]